ncbi:MAG: type II toxin-antitoxin system HicB family antitoxin [Thermoplasmata archaeon]
MKGRTFHVVIEKDEDGYFVGDVPELPGCHSQSKSLSKLRSRMKEAIKVYLDTIPRPSVGPSFVEVQTIEV